MAAHEPSWNPAMTSVEWLTPPPIDAGTKYRATMGGRLVMLVEITGFDRPVHLGSHTTSSLMTTDGAVTFTLDGGGTLLRWDWTYTLHGAARLLTPLMAVVGGRWERRNWVRMRDLLEVEGAP